MAGSWRVGMAVAALGLVLQGCFSARVGLVLHPDGAVSAEFRLTAPRIKGLIPVVPAVVAPLGARTTRTSARQLFVLQQARVSSLRQLCLRWMQVCITKTDIGLIGTSRASYELAVVIEPGGIRARWLETCRCLPLGPPAQPPPPQAVDAWRVGLGRAWVEVAVGVSGRVVWAGGEKVCGRRVGPVVEGGRVRWRIPVAELVGCRWTRPVVLRARFVGRYRLGGPRGSWMRTRPWKECRWKR